MGAFLQHCIFFRKKWLKLTFIFQKVSSYWIFSLSIPIKCKVGKEGFMRLPNSAGLECAGGGFRLESNLYSIAESFSAVTTLMKYCSTATIILISVEGVSWEKIERYDVASHIIRHCSDVSEQFFFWLQYILVSIEIWRVHGVLVTYLGRNSYPVTC